MRLFTYLPAVCVTFPALLLNTVIPLLPIALLSTDSYVKKNTLKKVFSNLSPENISQINHSSYCFFVFSYLNGMRIEKLN